MMFGVQRNHKWERPGCYRILRTAKAIALVFILVITTHWLDLKHLSISQNNARTEHIPSRFTESLSLDDLKEKHSHLLELEMSLLADSDKAFERAWSQMNTSLGAIISDLDSLTVAGSNDSSSPLAAKKGTLHTSRLLLKVEIAFLIVIGIIIQMIIFHPWRP